MIMSKIYFVTTEGAEEGRTTRNLGYFQGNVDDIAFFLVDKCAYALDFKEVEPDSIPVGLALKLKTVKIRLQNLLKKDEVSAKTNCLQTSTYGGYGYTLTRGEPTEEEKRESIKTAALAKLSDAEKKALGIH